ncbi:CopG family transcriptional regulator [Collimonas pratensis]|uniref:Ribbon-helix-helix, copG family protein n=2 Tax=Collimonas pratensis TaxID=279113 RepID=A0A127Q0U1_9BURK|nr:type II toxin-antitoxin system HicB family antitoxin [Collimonas pratensis]AMP03647.1 ribbon-helix-helix, copG family protein [Collimonas pratensis]NKI68202.1 CopG family transcriptional regulator [Collimonas pratensis]
MLYPLYVWKDKDSAYGASFPDLPGVFTAADELNALPAKAQEAAATMYEGETHIPEATSIEKWKDAADYANGYWMLVNIDRSRINTKPVRLNISLPENLLREIDAFAKAHQLTRSGFLAQAALKAMAR